MKNSVVNPTLCVARVYPERAGRATAGGFQGVPGTTHPGEIPQATGQTTSVFQAPGLGSAAGSVR